MRLEGGLDQWSNESRFESFRPGDLDGIPAPTSAVDFAGFRRQANVSGSFEPLDDAWRNEQAD